MIWFWTFTASAVDDAETVERARRRWPYHLIVMGKYTLRPAKVVSVTILANGDRPPPLS